MSKQTNRRLLTLSPTPKKHDVAQIWIAGALQNGDGVAMNGQVHIALPRPGEKGDD